MSTAAAPCTYLCVAQVSPPSVQFVRAALAVRAGRTDVIAYVDNPNAGAAAKDASYRIDLYGADNVLVASEDGTTDLPPHSTAADLRA